MTAATGRPAPPIKAARSKPSAPAQYVRGEGGHSGPPRYSPTPRRTRRPRPRPTRHLRSYSLCRRGARGGRSRRGSETADRAGPGRESRAAARKAAALCGSAHRHAPAQESERAVRSSRDRTRSTMKATHPTAAAGPRRPRRRQERAQAVVATFRPRRGDGSGAVRPRLVAGQGEAATRGRQAYCGLPFLSELAADRHQNAAGGKRSTGRYHPYMPRGHPRHSAFLRPQRSSWDKSRLQGPHRTHRRPPHAPILLRK